LPKGVEEETPLQDVEHGEHDMATQQTQDSAAGWNPKAWFSAFVTMPTIITAPGKYVTRCGEVVTVEVAKQKHIFGCSGTYSTGQREEWHMTGRLMFDRETPNDIVGVAS